jgi:hypothetical protein
MINFRSAVVKEEPISAMQWIERYPIAPLQQTAPVEFVIDNVSDKFIDLNRSRLYVKAKVTTQDGTAITHQVVKIARGTNETYEQVSLINLPLSSIWAQCDVYMQNRHVASTGWNGYPYKAYIDATLNYSASERSTLLKAQGYIEDTHDRMDGSNPDPKSQNWNTGLLIRYRMIKNGKSFEVEGKLFEDLFNLDNPILNGVPIKIRLTPSPNPFRLMSSIPANNYKLVLEEVKLMVCEITPSPTYYSQITNHLKTTTAKYPYLKTEMVTHGIQTDSSSLVLDNIFQGRVPSKMIVAMVSTSAFLGNYLKNPFNFQHFNLNYLNLMVNGMSVPDDQPLKPDYANDNYTLAYLRTVERKPTPLEPKHFKGGYNIYSFDIDPALQHLQQLPMTSGGNVKMELRFAQPLVENVTLIVLASFPQTIEIDANRNIFQS